MIQRVASYWSMGRTPVSIPVLMLSQLGFGVGFFMLLPYLAGYLKNELAFSAGMVGLVLGLRNFSQQGLYVIGGTLSDRLGYKPIITIGCFIRALGFLTFGLSTSVVGIVAAAFLSGFAGAFFSPAMQAYIAHEGAKERARLFAIFNVMGEVGAFAGPLLGMLLLRRDFFTVCVASASIFLILGLLQIVFLPVLDGVESKSKDHFLQDWKGILKNKQFICFSLGMMGYYVLFMQLYLCIPLALEQELGTNSQIGYLFFISALTAAVFQMHVHHWCKKYLKPGHAISLGLFLMGASFLFMVLKAVIPILIAAIIAVVVLTLGTLVSFPYVLAMIPLYGRERRLGTYYGFFYLAGGIASMLGNFVSGYVFDYGLETGRTFLSWIFLFLVGLLSAIFLLRLHQQGGIPEEKVGVTE